MVFLKLHIRIGNTAWKVRAFGLVSVFESGYPSLELGIVCSSFDTFSDILNNDALLKLTPTFYFHMADWQCFLFIY